MDRRKVPDNYFFGVMRVRLLRGFVNDRALLYVCLILASLAGLLVVGFGLLKSREDQKVTKQVEYQNRDWVENLVPKTADLTDVLLRDVTDKRSLVIFENGTVVIVSEPCEDPVEKATELLIETVEVPAFAVNQVDDDYAIRYSGPVFTRLSGTAVGEELVWINQKWESFMDPDELEAAEKKDEKPALSSKLGLVARSFMRRDAEGKKVVKILKAGPSASQNE